MDTIKFILFSIVVLAIVGFAGYWAVVSLQSGTEYTTTEKLAQLEQENADLKKEVENLKDELAIYKPKKEPVADLPLEKLAKEEPKPEPAKPATYKNQALIDELEKLVTDKVTMKLHSTGTRVGTIQKFLNIYNKTFARIDNDYGATTVKLVTAFQKDQGLKADGEASTNTFTKMIDWLKKQG